MNKKYWDTLFKNRAERLPPEVFLEKNYHYLSGKVLDLACGDGRNTIFLTEKGFEALALDFSEVALNKIEELNLFSATTYLCNLESIDDFKDIEGYNSVLINHYIPSIEILCIIQNKLKKNSILMMVAFADKDEIYSFDFEEIEETLTEMQTLKKEIYSTDIGTFNGIMLKKL